MPFNDIEQQRIRKIVGGFCEERIPDHLRNQIKVFFEVRGFEVRIMESRPSFMNSHKWMDHPIAKLRYDPYTLEWELYWMRATGKWQKYHELKPTNRLQSVVDEIKEDRFQVFWG
jgi:hypothetical protein